MGKGTKAMVAQGKDVPQAAVDAALACMGEPFTHADIVNAFIGAGFPFAVTATDLLIAREKRAKRIVRVNGKGWRPA